MLHINSISTIDCPGSDPRPAAQNRTPVAGRRTPPAILAALLNLFLLAGSAAAPDEDWRLIADKNGIQVYMKHEETRIRTFRGVTRFKLDNLQAMSGVLNDTPNVPRWMHFISHAREIRRSDYLNREYQFLTALPWPLADREAVVELLVRQDPSSKGVTISIINAPHLLPPNRDYVRFPQMTGVVSFFPTGRDHEIEVTYELALDPGGHVPAWIANFVLKDAPYFTLERLRRIVMRPEYQEWKEPVLQMPW